MDEHDSNEEQRASEEEREPEKEPITRLKLGPFEVEGALGPVGLLLVGLIVGVSSALYAVVYHGQPAIVIGPVITKAVSEAIAAQPTATPLPTYTPPPTPLPTLRPAPAMVPKVTDVTTGSPTRGDPIPLHGEEYRVNPGGHYRIDVEPEDKHYKLTLSCTGGNLREANGTPAFFTAPKDVRRCTVTVSQLDKFGRCCEKVKPLHFRVALLSSEG